MTLTNYRNEIVAISIDNPDEYSEWLNGVVIDFGNRKVKLHKPITVRGDGNFSILRCNRHGKEVKILLSDTPFATNKELSAFVNDQVARQVITSQPLTITIPFVSIDKLLVYRNGVLMKRVINPLIQDEYNVVIDTIVLATDYGFNDLATDERIDVISFFE